MKKVIVISLGGSQIIPDKVNYSYLKKFKEVIIKHKKKYKIVVVCGGGNLARKYIEAIAKEKGDLYHQSLVGINATRANARFVSYFFGYNPEWGIPHNIKTLKKYLKKRNFVICGALKYKPNQTSDSTAAEIARKLKGEFVNVTNIKGLYDKNPKMFKNAKYIPKITWKKFNKLAQKIKFKPGQHFVLDQTASKIIMENKIKTLIIKDVKELDNFLKNKKFVGTVIEG
ncbi:MAG: UMP kinase [Nanoarchaeota archaeon]|nr:UMP kinase [Nanoarchaeota archaeon]